MSTAVTFALNNQDQLTLQRLSGPLGANFDALSKSLNVEIRRAAEELLIKGEDADVGLACLQQLLSLAQQRELTDTDIQLAVVAAKAQQVSEQVQNEFRERERERLTMKNSNTVSAPSVAILQAAPHAKMATSKPYTTTMWCLA